MRSSKFHATTALGLCLMMAPVAVSAQEDAAAEQPDGLYAPLVEACRDNPETDGCDAVRARVGECVESYDARLCEVLLADPTMDGAEDPEARAVEAIEALQVEFADLAEPAPDAPAPEEMAQVEAPEPVVEAAEAPAESEAVTEDAEPAEMAEAEAAPELEAVEEEARIEETESEETQVDEAEADAAQAADEMVDDTPAAADAAAAEEAAPEDDAVADQDAAAEEVAETAEEPQPDAAMPDAESIAAAEEEERALEEERARLRAEAEAMADEAPELVVEDAPEEEFVAPVEQARELDAAEQATVDRLLEDPEVATAVGLLGSVLASRLAPAGDDAPDDQPPAAALAAREAEEGEAEAELEEEPEVIEESITAAQLRSSQEDFASRLSLDVDASAGADRARRDRRDLERAGLAALGALAVGMIVNRNRVVARSDERVVVDTGEGDLELWRDDDAILLQDGSTRRIERFSDGSTRTRWIRPDGTHVVTVRDATGRVLRRERIAPDGSMVELLDDTRQYAPIDVSVLPPPRTRELRISQRTDPELALAMLREAEAEARAIDRSFSLRQVRETRELRDLLPLLSPEPITFETNRANVRADEAPKLLQVGRLMERLIADNPREMFLIEGHTDATGPAAYNLALSDRRAESVALALTEFFEIPPENLVVQGYGERHLRIPTLDSEVRNRRVAIRRITPLIDS